MKDKGPPSRIAEVYEDEAHEWRWRLKALNGETVADSAEGYTRRSDCTEAIEREFPEAELRFLP